MKTRYLLLNLSIAASMLLSGCATTGKSVALGSVVGAGAGASIGAIADPGPHGQNRIRNILVGTAIGGVAGAGAGYIGDRIVKDEKDDAYKKGKADRDEEISRESASAGTDQPHLVPAKTEARWIPDQVRGGTFVPGHFEYLIIQGAHWDAGK